MDLVDQVVVDWLQELLTEQFVVRALQKIRRRLTERLQTMDSDDSPRLHAEAQKLKGRDRQAWPGAPCRRTISPRPS